ncbi:MAG: winged helix DNA-binding protein [Clostridiales bacterium]|jgi:DNA-binding MarR family transcriptional regulator|nr:winged helix DNA-binding protein [Clostridiales bacterium]
MDFSALAVELIGKMRLMQKSGHQKSMQDGIHGESFLLYCIKEKHGESVPSEIGSKMGVSGPRIAAELASLEGKGLITREVDSTDRRRILVRLTQKGIAVEAEQQGRYIGRVAAMLQALGERDAEEYIRITGRLAELKTGTEA